MRETDRLYLSKHALDPDYEVTMLDLSEYESLDKHSEIDETELDDESWWEMD
jgi:hypothetical protein